MPMADFGFYEGVYLGCAIPEKAFPGMAARAREALERFQNIYRVTIPGEESRKMAICAMAEAIYAASKRGSGVSAASVGEVSVRYESGRSAARSLQRELYDRASIYLDISRGVAG